MGALRAELPEGLTVTFEIDKIVASKERYRRKLAALPIGEKLRLLDRLREREVALRAARQVQKAGCQSEEASSVTVETDR